MGRKGLARGREAKGGGEVQKGSTKGGVIENGGGAGGGGGGGGGGGCLFISHLSN